MTPTVRFSRRRFLAATASLWVGAAGVVRRARAAEPGVMRLAHVVEWDGKESLDPASPHRMFPCVDLLYNHLVRGDEHGVPRPELAVSWKSDPSARLWTFELRDGVRFHDGTPLTAADVVATLKHVVDPATASPGAAALEILDPAKLAAPSPRTVTIELREPHADFPVLLMHYSCYIAPAAKLGQIAKTGVGTGPFKLETLAPEGTTVLVPNEAYWEGKPRLARIEVVGIADQEARVNALLADQLDMIGGASAASVETFRANPAFSVHELETGNWLSMAMRTDRAPFDKVEVRRAFKLAVDRPALIKAALGGHGVVAADHPVWSQDAYALKLSPKHDPVQARELLKAAGHPDGLDVVLHTAPAADGMVAMAVAYQSMAAAAGIRIEIRQTSSDGYWNSVWQKEPFCCSSWGERPADQVLAEIFRAGAPWNETAWSNPAFAEVLKKARGELDAKKRTAHYHAAQQLIADDGGAIIPFFRNQLRTVSTRVRGIDAKVRDWDWVKVEVG